MAEQYTFKETETPMVNDESTAYSSGVTIPISLPSTGNYTVEDLKRELTDFAMKLLQRKAPASTTHRSKWREIAVSDKVKAMTLGPSELSRDTRSDKELLANALDEKYK